ncbi:MAG: efflux RND transporter periplasmic adaptor subunit [Lachnospirales bacterium]
MKFMKKTISAILIGTLAISTVSCSSTETAEEVQLTAVRVADTSIEPISKSLSYTVQFQSNNNENVISPMVAKVEKTYFEVGDYVEEGEVLFELDKESIEDQLAQLEQQIDLANIGLENANITAQSVTGGQYESQIMQLETSISGLESQIVTTKDSVELAETAYKNAQAGYDLKKASHDMLLEEYERNKILFENGLTSKIEMEQLQIQVDASVVELEGTLTSVQQAKNALTQAQEGLKTLEENLETTKKSYDLTTGTITEENKDKAGLAVKQAETSLASAQLQYDIAKKTLDDLSVTAPSSGVINAKGVKEGDYASNSSVAYQIMDKDTVYANVKVTERVINNVQPNDKVEVEFSSLDEPLIGTVETVSPSVDQTNTYTVKVVLDNTNNDILLGSFAKVKFIIEESENSIVLPRNIVLSDEESDFVYTVVDGVAKKTLVETGIDNGEYIEVLSGLSVGDKVIIEGQSYVSNEESVNIVE